MRSLRRSILRRRCELLIKRKIFQLEVYEYQAVFGYSASPAKGVLFVRDLPVLQACRLLLLHSSPASHQLAVVLHLFPYQLQSRLLLLLIDVFDLLSAAQLIMRGGEGGLGLGREAIALDGKRLEWPDCLGSQFVEGEGVFG